MLIKLVKLPVQSNLLTASPDNPSLYSEYSGAKLKNDLALGCDT